jgi:hypothetical protein
MPTPRAYVCLMNLTDAQIVRAIESAPSSNIIVFQMPGNDDYRRAYVKHCPNVFEWEYSDGEDIDTIDQMLATCENLTYVGDFSSWADVPGKY